MFRCLELCFLWVFSYIWSFGDEVGLEKLRTYVRRWCLDRMFETYVSWTTILWNLNDSAFLLVLCFGLFWFIFCLCRMFGYIWDFSGFWLLFVFFFIRKRIFGSSVLSVLFGFLVRLLYYKPNRIGTKNILVFGRFSISISEPNRNRK